MNEESPDYELVECPYDELDAPVVELCRTLNSFDGIYTIGSCGGHPGDEGELPEDEWRVTFQIELGDDKRPTADGWLAAEFVAWAIDNLWPEYNALLRTWARPPWLNFGRMMCFQIEGLRGGEHGVEPDEVAEFIQGAASGLVADRG